MHGATPFRKILLHHNNGHPRANGELGKNWMLWIPAFAGMTKKETGSFPKLVGNMRD
jgi:hypothetical protein